MTAITGYDWQALPTMLWRTLLLSDYNTRVVLLGAGALGAACGLVGALLLLRRRALFCDAITHAMLPGIVLAFLLGNRWGLQEKNWALLFVGAAAAALAGTGCVLAITRLSRLKEDVGQAVVLGTFFALGAALLVFAQQVPSASVAGLDHFLFGKVAAMTLADARWILTAAIAAIVLSVLLFKEWKLAIFDPIFAQTQGWPVGALDAVLLILVMLLALVGMQAVGLLLVIALFILPAASARFWTETLGVMAAVSCGIGAGSAVLGATISALLPRLPAGAIMVLVAAMCFVVSFLFGQQRGLVIQWRQEVQARARIDRQHVLRAFYETQEQRSGASSGNEAVTLSNLLEDHAWSQRRLRRLLAGAQRRGLLQELPHEHWRLTSRGKAEAEAIVRNHRLWELYLTHYGDVVPAQAHRFADQIEHVVDPAVAARLSALLEKETAAALPASLHRLDNPAIRSSL